MALKHYRHSLRWIISPPDPNGLPPPPAGVERTWIMTSGGRLELLYALPAGERESWRTPLIFVHGGFEQASCYANFLPYFSHSPPPENPTVAGHPCFAISLRGHGHSYQPGFLRMYFTSKYQLTLDICAAIKHIFTSPDLLGTDSPASHIPPEFVIFGHSSGGGLVQYLLQSPLYQNQILQPSVASIKGIAILAGIPCFGSLGVYYNWMVRHDPWAFCRTYFRHFGHPRSPLSTTALVRGAFFSKEMPEEQVVEFEKTMPEWESMLWAFGMMMKGWIDIPGVLKGLLSGSGKNRTQDRRQRMLVVAGGEDKLMGVTLMEKMTAIYRGLWKESVLNVWGDIEIVKQIAEEADERVEFQVVHGSGHHLMKDVYWRDCAAKIGMWLGKF